MYIYDDVSFVEFMYPDIRRMHTRWSCHRRLGSLMQCASSMCDVNCSSAITSHCLLEDVTLVEYVPCIGSSHARWSCRRRLGPLLVCACSMCDVNCSSAAITFHCLLNGLYNYNEEYVSKHLKTPPRWPCG